MTSNLDLNQGFPGHDLSITRSEHEDERKFRLERARWNYRFVMLMTFFVMLVLVFATWWPPGNNTEIQKTAASALILCFTSGISFFLGRQTRDS